MINFKRQFLQWNGAAIPMNDPSSLLRKTDLTSRKMCKMIIQTVETVSTREATEIMVTFFRVPIEGKPLTG